MVKTLTMKIGNLEIESPVILAPMSGVTDLPFRRLVKSFGAGLVISEMIASEAIVRDNRRTLRMASFTPEEFPFAIQLAGCNPKTMAAAAKLNEDRGANIIDINMGCPVKKVVNGEAGSALMRDLDHAKAILTETVKAVAIPVTLKMRTGWNDETRNAAELARIAEGVGIKMITVHGRTRCQMYRDRSDWAFIRTVKDAVTLPVIVNGDIISFDDVDTALEKSGADGVMIGRGAYGRPWFVADVMHYLKTGERRRPPPFAKQLATILSHYQAMLDHYGIENGLRIARKHLGWYTKGLPNSAELRQAMNQMTDPEVVVATLKDFFIPLMDKKAA